MGQMLKSYRDNEFWCEVVSPYLLVLASSTAICGPGLEGAGYAVVKTCFVS